MPVYQLIDYLLGGSGFLLSYQKLVKSNSEEGGGIKNLLAHCLIQLQPGLVDRFSGTSTREQCCLGFRRPG